MYLFIFFIGFSQRIASIIVRGHGSLRTSLILALFGTAYMPIGNALCSMVVLTKSEMKQLSNALLNPLDGQSVNFFMDHPLKAGLSALITIVFAVFLIFHFVGATAYVHHVGKLQSIVICLLTLLFTAIGSVILANRSIVICCSILNCAILMR